MKKMYDENEYIPKHSKPANDDIKNENNSFDYVLPVVKSKKKKEDKTEKASRYEKQYSKDASDFCFAQPYNSKKEKKKKSLKVVSIVICSIAAVLVLVVVVLGLFTFVGKNSMHNYDDMNIEFPADIIKKIESVDNAGKTIVYKGSTYKFNEKVATITFMGIDTKDFEHPQRVVGEGGQADAIYIGVIDTSTNKLTLLGVSRDTMVDVNIYNKDGKFVNTENMQICLSYAYGDGAHTSCDNTLVSLERLFYGMQYDTYFSFDTRALEALTDAVGGVTVTALSDFYSDYHNRTIKAGEEVTLYGNDAIMYTRSRNINELDSNNDRMARQNQFIKAFIGKIWDSVKSDPTTVLSLYNIVAENSTTNLTPAKMVYLTTKAISGLDSYTQINYVNLKGEIKKGEYAEFYPDEEALMETLLDLFYIKVN